MQSEETKRRISRANKGKKRPKTSVEKIIAAHWSKGPNAKAIKARLAEAGRKLVGTNNPNYRTGRFTRKEDPSGS